MSYGRPDFTDHRSSYVIASKYNTQMRKIKQQKKMNGKKEKSWVKKKKAIWDDKETGVEHKGKRGMNDICMKKGCLMQY